VWLRRYKVVKQALRISTGPFWSYEDGYGPASSEFWRNLAPALPIGLLL